MYLVKSAVFYGTKVGGNNSYTANISAYEYTGNTWDENTVSYNSASLDKGIVLKNSTNNANSNYVRTMATSEYAVNVNATAMPYIAITYYVPININNGTYFVKKIYSGRYMDVEGPSNNAGANIQQWDFHGERQSQFLFSRQGDGTYTIKSLYSNMYVGVENNSSSSAARIKQYSTSSSTGTRWIVYASSSGNYILMPKSSMNTECVLSLPSSSNMNGTDFIQSKYCSDSNMRDEWCLSHVQIFLYT